MAYTGRVIYQTLIQYDTSTGQPTGVTKVNDPGDPDYIEPYIDENACPSGTSITLSNTFLYFGSEGGTQFITVTSDADWEVNSSLGFGVTPTTGVAGTTQVEISVLQTNNDYNVEYTTDFTLTNTTISTTLTVYQEGNTGQL